MRKKLMLLATLNCAAGGWLLAPAWAAAPPAPPYCDDLVWQPCEPETTTLCRLPGGTRTVLSCQDGTWQYPAVE